jgi:hypothetical protein
MSFIAENPHLIESKDCESSVIQSILNSILGAPWPLFVTPAHSRAAGNSILSARFNGKQW